MDARKEILWKIYIVFFALCLFALAIVVQIARIQFVEGDYWRSKADSLTLDYKRTEAARGSIFSDDGSLLATSVPVYDLRMDLLADGLTDELFNEQVDSLAGCLSSVFGGRSGPDVARELRRARAAGERYYLIQRNVSYKDMQAAKKFPLFRLGRYKGGLRVEQRNVRNLPFRELAARTIGYMRDVRPVGIEASFDQDLTGVSGKRLMQKISGNVWMPVNDINEIEPKNGNDIYTTIDINIQDVAEEALRTQLTLHQADHGCAVLMEVATGEIKAIANLRRNAAGTYAEDYNYAIGESTEPGSTMKMASLLAAMDDHLVDPTDSVTVGNGYTTYFGQPMEDSHAPHAPRLTVQRAFETSSNVGISRVIYQHYAKHPEQFVEKLKSFHLKDPIGLQIAGENKPVLKSPGDKGWSEVTLPWMAIGYEVQLTPLQMLTFYNAIANNGKMVKPLFVKEIRQNGVVVKTFGTEVIDDSICSAATLVKARRLLEGVVDSGTATNIRNPYYAIAGKTGTAQTNYAFRNQVRRYQASFVGYFPADRPQYSCIVVVNSPSNNVYYGGAVAAPIFKEIADKVYASHLDLHPPYRDSVQLLARQRPAVKCSRPAAASAVLSALQLEDNPLPADARWVVSRQSKEAYELTERKFKPGAMPDVTGMGIRDALYVLENAGLRVQVNGRGSVVRQSVTAGSPVQHGELVALELGL
jgi:cell division protein FtsI (penicillin-binding protein 3)